MDKSALTFPYQYKQSEFGRIFNPLIQLPIKTIYGWQYLWFLVDSGADTTMLTISLAKRLRLNFDLSKKTNLFGIAEKSTPAYPGHIYIKLGSSELKIRSYFIDAEDSMLLLGRVDVFDKFNIEFNADEEKVVFLPKK